MNHRLAVVALLVAASLVVGCRDPVAPEVPNCDDAYRPAMCLDSDEVCETDDRGCRVCTCNSEE
jgi:hypothetical protein